MTGERPTTLGGPPFRLLFGGDATQAKPPARYGRAHDGSARPRRAGAPARHPARARPSAAARSTGPAAGAGRPTSAAHTPASAPRRLHVVLIMLAVGLSLCAGRLLQLQGFDSSAYAADAQLRTLPLLPSRGDMTDRNGMVLAATEPAVAVTADPSLTSRAPQSSPTSCPGTSTCRRASWSRCWSSRTPASCT